MTQKETLGRRAGGHGGEGTLLLRFHVVYVFFFFMCFLSLFTFIAYKTRRAASLAGTLSATHPTTPTAVTNDAHWSPRSRRSALNEKKEGQVSQTRT